MPALNDDNITKLSYRFSAILRETLSDREMADVITRNREYVDPMVCASHDFCDANEVMAEAWVDCFGASIDLQSDDMRSMWNAAWEMSKDDLRLKTDPV